MLKLLVLNYLNLMHDTGTATSLSLAAHVGCWNNVAHTLDKKGEVHSSDSLKHVEVP